ncbi:hypothetical protein QZJ86_18815 [Methylomonas montana]|uniref:hypothetical protein n=1 Tax=Methylomonas montana TaxID=3058963 RepID=UPI00265ADD3A|nr:hypothetical protein [Methylomonas montana]WKJ90036.1 hypothetical protein QZJ86_18815 [Methylomonas montana]
MKLSVLAGVLAASLTGATEAHASQVVVTFEDIGPNAGGQIYDGYGGISGWESTGQWSDYSGTDRNPALGDYFFHGWGGELSFDQAPVVFEGTYYNLWGSDSRISYSLYYQGQLVYNAPLDPANQPIESYWLASGYSGLVDKIYFYGSSDGFVVDNLTYSTAAPVPLPGAAWLFGAGLVGVLARGKRRQNHRSQQFTLE